MTCRELVDVITDYIEGTLPAEERRASRRTSEECPYCVSYLAQMRETIGTLGELREETALAGDARRACSRHSGAGAAPPEPALSRSRLAQGGR